MNEWKSFVGSTVGWSSGLGDTSIEVLQLIMLHTSFHGEHHYVKQFIAALNSLKGSNGETFMEGNRKRNFSNTKHFTNLSKSIKFRVPLWLPHEMQRNIHGNYSSSCWNNKQITKIIQMKSESRQWKCDPMLIISVMELRVQATFSVFSWLFQALCGLLRMMQKFIKEIQVNAFI